MLSPSGLLIIGSMHAMWLSVADPVRERRFVTCRAFRELLLLLGQVREVHMMRSQSAPGTKRRTHQCYEVRHPRHCEIVTAVDWNKVKARHSVPPPGGDVGFRRDRVLLPRHRRDRDDQWIAHLIDVRLGQFEVTAQNW